MNGWTNSDIARLLTSLETPGVLGDADRAAAAEVVRALAESAAVLAQAAEQLETRLAIRTSGDEAAGAVRAAVGGAIQRVETVEGVADAGAAMRAVEELRASIARGERGKEAVVAGVRFALRLAGRLV